MKKLDDLVFKNLHGLKDEEDETKHKHDKKNPGDFNMGTSQDSFPQGHTQTDYNKMLELQQKQQQLMYNYYMMQQRQQQNPQYGGQQLPPFNPAFLQNMQNMQNMQNRQQMQGMQNIQPNMNMNASNVNNPFGPMSQANQFSQMNRALQQNQYAQMYQNQMSQAVHSGQAGQFGQINQGFTSGNQNFQAKKVAPTNDFDDFGDFSTSSGVQQQNQGYSSSAGFKGQANINKHDDDFADFQGASASQQHAHGNQPDFQNFGQSNMGGFSTNFSAPTGDFDDFQDSTGGKAGLSTTQASTTKGDDFTDFQNPSGGQAEGQNWDMLDDFIGKKPENVPTQTIQNHPQSQVQQGAHASNIPHPHPHANVHNISMPTQNIHFHQGMQNLQNLQVQPNFFGASQINQEAGRNMNFYNQGVVGQQGNKFSPQKDEDDFAEFEEAKPTHPGAGNQAKPATKEDLLFGALENKVLKTLGYSQAEIPEGEGFGGFEEAKPQQAHEGDDFEEFEQATQNVGHQQENIIPDKKLTIYDIDLAEFGITENTAQPQSASQGLGVPPEDKPLDKPQNVEIQEEFEDFVEIRDENENKETEQVHVTHPVHSQGQGLFNQFGQGDSMTKPTEHPASSDWDFGDFATQPAQTNLDNKPQPSPQVDDDEFNDFEGPQVKPKEDVVHIQDEGDGFDDFQVVGSTHNKNDFEALEVKKETEEKVKQNKFEDFEFEKTAHHKVQGNDWYKDFTHSDKEKKVTHPNEQPIGKAHNDFSDFGFNFSSVTISAGDKQTTIINEEAPVENIKQEKGDEDFEDFEEFKNVDEAKKEHEKLEHKEEVKPAHKEDEEEDFGDFEGETKPEKEKERVHEEAHKEETPKEEDLSKKLTIYDIDLAEFGIQEGSQPGLPQIDLNFGKPSQVEPSTKEEKKPTGISDLYSLYEHTSGTPIGTPITAEQQPKTEHLFGETLETQNIQDTEQTGKHALSPQEGNDDFDDFEDFSAAPKQETHAAVKKTPEKGDDMFAEFHQGTSGNKTQEHHDFDFGNFESSSQPSKPGTHHEISHAKQEPKINESQGEDDHDDFDNFEEAGHAEVKPVKEEIAAKSLSQFEGNLHRDVSDFGSLNDVGHHDGESKKKTYQHAGPRGSTELDRGISIDAPEKEHGDEEAHDDFGAFTNAEQKRKHIANLKDESIFNPADSSDYSPAKDKEADEHNEEFGDFVASKQDIKGKTQEVIVEEVEQFTLEAVLAEYGIKDEEEPEEVDLTQYIEKRVEEINSEYQANLFNTSYARTELSKGKFKLNRRMIEEIVKELSSIQKYKEASNCEGQITVLEELDTLNDTKRQLIEDEKLEEAIQYRDLIKNKEKEVITKERLEEFLSYYTDDNAKFDYRVLLLEELKAAQVPMNYINDFCLRFIGNLPKILKKTNIIQINNSNKPEEIVTQPPEPQNDKLQGDDSYHKIESQPVKEHEDNEDFGDFEGDNQTPPEEVQTEVKPEEKAEEEQPETVEKKEDSHHKIENPHDEGHDNEDFGDFEGDNQTPTEEIQGEVKPEEEAEEEQPETVEKKNESQVEESNEDFGDFEKSPENKKDSQTKSEGEKADEGFGDFEDTNQPEIQGEKDEKENQKEENEEDTNKNEEPKENHDQGSSDFENVGQAEPSGEPEQKEEGQDSLENKNKSQTEEQDEGFGDFDNAGHTEDEKGEKEKETDKEDNNEKGGETEVVNQNVEVKEDEGDDFEDFKHVEDEKKPEEAAHVEDNQEEIERKGEENKSEEENKIKEAEELQNEDNEDFGEFEDSKTPKEQDEHQEKQVAEGQEDDEDFGDFEGHEQKDQEKNKEVQEEVIQTDKIESQVESDNTQKEEEQQRNKVPSEKDDGNEDFGEFEDFNQNQNQPETETKEIVNEEKEQKADVEGQVAEQKEANNDSGDFEDFSHPEPAATKVEERHVEVYYIDEEEIETLPPAPQNLLELQNLKEETIKWALLAKVIGSSGNKFDSHIKKLLNQIVFELHRFTKFSEKIFNDSNRNSAKIVITSSKYETYIKGIQVFIAFYKELKTAYEFLNTRKQPTKLYQKPLEDLIAKVHNILSQIEQDFGKDFTYDVKNEGGQDLPLINQGLNAELLAHVCHLSLKIHMKKLTEYSGKHYFLPYLNFLLNIS